ncbi:glycosyltransferase family 2 protein [Arthrobacter sp. MMS18-M83]|uniref:glycosyltransferase family 2 protein n=1 Tax=Arthrobacter sp. MMS18-M83 TaxID=2996261 RepID=UPI00227AC1CB|nr:glycosyltransferase family 2 protein [Arthrobacter sp. MMS18-M83]WAH98139.1 glycosyltransferase [Arthrobacter sp. MMS18-M83]
MRSANTAEHTRVPARIRSRRSLAAKDLSRAGLAGWVMQMGAPSVEPVRSRRMARIGGVTAVVALIMYLTWRAVFTLPAGDWNMAIAEILLSFEALPLAGMILNVITLWSIDSPAPAPVTEPTAGMRVAVLIPTYNEPLEVIAPTIAAACALAPVHETWVLDDGDRDWVRQLCRSYGARYVRRDVHDHAKAGNMNHALDLMAREEAGGAPAIDIIAVLDCDHVPLPAFLTATLGWFNDEEIALVQGPQSFYNGGAFDDDGVTGEQGLFFNVQMRARSASGEGPFWCGSTSFLRVSALREVGGVATDTITEDMHTTLKLIRAGWKTAYHHQTLALGLAPDTPEQYLLQRRRWGMGAMQILAHERLWTAKSWMSWRTYHEYLNGTLWWLEGIATLVAFFIPVLMLASGAQTSTAPPLMFAAVFLATFSARLWGAKRLMRHQIHWPTAFALRIFRIPVGIACLWWLISRKTLKFEVTPKGAAHARLKGSAPRILIVLLAIVGAVLLYAGAGSLGWVPWRTGPASTAAACSWLILAAVVLALGIRRIHAAKYSTSRRNAHRISVPVTVKVNGVATELRDISVGGASVVLPLPMLSGGAHTVRFQLPGADVLDLEVVSLTQAGDGSQIVTLKTTDRDWDAYRTLSMWLFHTPEGAIPHFPAGVPAVASTLTAPPPLPGMAMNEAVKGPTTNSR